ncbi:LON peptidase substrate-binding domain-containing protein [Alteromonas sp. CYL-A6]|uniref:LON peptidase substrate-binding domain-containing protein n=1 Tax=Alteromonas nitratireducens TaxID=3390813 RepID=UPI0034A89538
MDQYELPLFPLSAHLLPGGRMSLRIFEPRYVRMVKEACASGKGFVMCMLNARGDKEANEHIFPIGTYAEVIDFDLLEDGLLGIKIAGIHSVEVTDIRTEHDGLRVGKCETVQPWCCDISPQQIAPMDERLQEIFERYHELGAMYDNPAFDDPVWVMHRWLELLPVDARQKQHFLQQKDCRKLMNYLSALIE